MNPIIYLLEKYNTKGPRYTSYPPATEFTKNFTPLHYINQIQLSNKQNPNNLSLYIHIPFCPQRCFFCGCNTTAYTTNEEIITYIACLKKEIKTIAKYIDKNRTVTQIHWGGGTPNAIDISFINEIMELLFAEFLVSSNAEIAMECNPAYLTFEYINKLKKIHFNRISLGVQDFNNNVLAAINRKQPQLPLESLLNYLKQKGFTGTNIDLVYGLPFQTIDSFKETIHKAVALNPNRLVTFSYAHVPWFNEQQNKLNHLPLPTPNEKITMLITAYNILTENNYIAIGMDHFAKPDDELSIAKKNKTLHRNFQGYCTESKTGQVYAFGASAISQLTTCYAQNFKSTANYIKAIQTTGTATERGYLLSKPEQIIGNCINQIMCNGILNFTDIANKYAITTSELKNIISFDTSKFQSFIQDNLISLTENELCINDTGMFVIRNIAMAFDPIIYKNNLHQYSQTL